jgi:prevent-host-death family protein
MKTEISKSEFKARALEILRAVENTGQSILITDRGIPTVEIRPYRGHLRDAREILKGSVLAFVDPTEPTDEDWQSLD